MPFPHEFESSQISEWSIHYINYRQLSTVIDKKSKEWLEMSMSSGGYLPPRLRNSAPVGLIGESVPKMRPVLTALLKSSAVETIADYNDADNGRHMSRDIVFRRQLAEEIEKVESFYELSVDRIATELGVMEKQAAATR